MVIASLSIIHFPLGGAGANGSELAYMQRASKLDLLFLNISQSEFNLLMKEDSQHKFLICLERVLVFGKTTLLNNHSFSTGVPSEGEAIKIIWFTKFFLGTGQKCRKWLQRLQEKGLIESYQTSNKTLRYNEPT